MIDITKTKINTNAYLKTKYFDLNFQDEMIKNFTTLVNRPDLGFYSFTEDQTHLEQTKVLHKKYQSKKHFVQIGIGGSALGPKMLISALQTDRSKTFTFLDNIDSDYITEELEKIDLKEALFYVVSKSGGTAETIACFSLVRNMLKEQGIHESEFQNYFVFCTDPEGGQLRDYVKKHNFDSLAVPSNVGGRFSVLTAVGLFPAIFAGVNIDELFEGANSIKKLLLNTDLSENYFIQTASHILSLYLESKPRVDETVLMPYSSKLKEFSFWFVQLWAESLGKIKSTAEGSRSVGLTPIPAYGATDQHSQVQLFMEGPNNKCLFLININNHNTDYKLDSELELESAQKLAPYTMNQLMEAEFNGTLKALQENDRNFIQLELDKITPHAMGNLIVFFESLTAIVGHYLEIDPFNQPGVEKGKKYAFEFLNTLK